MLFKIKTLLANILKIFLTILAAIFLASCSPRVIEKVDKQIDTLYQTKYQHDSIYLHDSVATFIHAAGDTIFVDRYKSTIKYKERLKTDTLRQIREVTKVDTKVVEVKKKNGKFSPFVFGFLLGGLLLLILEKICFIKNRNS